jgi:TRAP transporter 4TM/12TM fusion protein
MGAVYWIGTGVQAVAGAAAIWVLLAILAVLYLWLLRVAARHPDLPQDIDINHPVRPQPWPTVRAGLYFLIPIGILVWCLSVEELSAGLSAFWAAMAMLFQMVTQRPLIAWFRKQPVSAAWRHGWRDAIGGLEDGARNMIGIAIACGTAGLIVGAITLTGLGLRMTAFVELVSMGNVLLMLIFTAVVCLILGLGMPTTANYILMATLMAPVVVELGAQSGLVIPLIAVHMFVFYYGIMADITPPVGLATFAAAAISGEDPIKTGIQGVTYAARTAILPFMFVFNPMLLLIDVTYGWELALVVTGATIASLTFAAATMRWFRVRCTLAEVGVLLLVTFMLFRPDWFMDHFAPRHESRPASEMQAIAGALPDNGRLTVVLRGINLEGDELTKTVAVALPELTDNPGGQDAGRKRLAEAGLTLMSLGDQTQIGGVRFGSRAQRAGWEQGWDVLEVKVPNPQRWSDFWVYVPALLLLAGMWARQGRRDGGAPVGRLRAKPV